MKVYSHVDADCFYVSCERLRDPNLEGLPVAVLGNQGACVIAASYEMKDAGVEVAMPIWKAKKICPQGIFIKRDFRWYGVLSKAMQEVLHEFTDHIEYYSVDESFMDLGQPTIPLSKLAKQIQDRMWQRTGLPISVGIGGTRLLSKLGSKRNKPMGTVVITEENREYILRNTPIGKVNGIGRRLIKRMPQHQIENAWDFVSKGRAYIKQHLHKPGETIWYELSGTPILPICPERGERKIVSRGGSIWGHYKNPTYIWGFLVRNFERFLTELWAERLEILKLGVILRTSGGHSFQSTVPLPDYTSDHSTLFAALKQAFKLAYHSGPTYCRVHIVGQPIRLEAHKQLNLFEVDREEDAIVKRLKAEVNQRYGLFTLRNASSAYAAEVFRDKVSDYEITDISGKHLF